MRDAISGAVVGIVVVPVVLIVLITMSQYGSRVGAGGTVAAVLIYVMLPGYAVASFTGWLTKAGEGWGWTLGPGLLFNGVVYAVLWVSFRAIRRNRNRSRGGPPQK